MKLEKDLSHGEEEKSREEGNQQQHYGTFQGVSNYPQINNSAPVTGFPQPAPPSGAYEFTPPNYTHGYQTVPVHGDVVGRPVTGRQRRLPCCGLGLGWFLFIVGFIFGAIPWYFGMVIMIFGRRIDHREKPGYIACTIAAILATVALILGISKGAHEW